MAAPLCKRYMKKQKICIILTLSLIGVVIVLAAIPPKYEDRTDIFVANWPETPTAACEDQFIGYANEFAVLHNAKFDRRNKTFTIPCKSSLPKYHFSAGKEGTPLQEWYQNLKTIYPTTTIDSEVELRETLTVVVMRNEAHNIYHTLCEWYNIFLLSRLMHFDPTTVDILFMDDRPPGLMDETWDVLFGTIIRYTDVKPGTVFSNLIWNVIGYESPMNFHMLPELPYADKFYNFFVSSFGINPTHDINCRKLSAVIIWRRDYLSHPERAMDFNGYIHRKFKNEHEILHLVKSVLPHHVVRGVVLEQLSMKEQVHLLSGADILIGMHGAGMAHTILLPRHAAVFEMFPNYWGFLKHFKAFSRWRNLKYIGWQNHDKANEYPHFDTYIPREVIKQNVLELSDYQSEMFPCPGW